MALPSRPIHTSVDRSGEFLLTAYNIPSNVTVHRLEADGTIGELVHQPAKLDTGIYAHQVLTTPSNQTAILVTRGNNAAPGKPEDPGALKLYGFKRGVLTDMASIAPGTGHGFGPRHLDFHPDQAVGLCLDRAAEPARRLRLAAATARLAAIRCSSRTRIADTSRAQAGAAGRRRSMFIRTAASST